MSPSLKQLASAFVRYANLTFGGGSATIAVLHREIVEKRTLVDQDRFNLIFALSRLTPGTNLLAFCAGIGWLLHGFQGAVVALLAASLPCSLIVLMVSYVFEKESHNPTAETAIAGAMAAAVGITIMTCWTIIKPHFKRSSWPRVLLIGGLAFALDLVFSIPPVRVLLLAGILGYLLPSKSA